MAVFDTSFLLNDRSKSGAGGPGILVDQLQILENSLKGDDGILSNGDYDLLIAQAQKLANVAPTASSRSNFMVKATLYQSQKSVKKFQATEDLSNIQRTLKNESAERVFAVGTSPGDIEDEQGNVYPGYLSSKVDSLATALSDLAEIIDRKEAVGEDATEYKLELRDTIGQYNDAVQANEAGKTWGKDSQAPISGYAAYVTTNPQGEVTDVDYLPIGNRTGYNETNAMINGFQVFGKATNKDGKKVFKLMNETFSGVDSYAPDPNNPGSFSVQPTRLIAQSQQSGSSFNKRGSQGFLNFDSTNLLTQSYVPRNSWAKTADGTLYKRREDGAYSKYVNYEPEGVDLGSIPTFPNSMFSRLNVDETIDGAEPIQKTIESLPNGQYYGEATKTMFDNPQEHGTPPATDQPPAVGPVAPKVNQRAPGPTSRSPQTAPSYARQTINKAGKFFKDMFS